jgi:uncharacterized protein (DUF1697 family)
MIGASRAKGQMAVALLRGINVGGKNLLPMQALEEIFAGAGCRDIRTYIQSGNVVFRPDRPESDRPEEVAKAVGGEIAARFGLKVPVVVRTAEEFRGALEGNPFLARGLEADWLHVMFLAEEPSDEAMAGLDAERSVPDEFLVRGREVYLYLPNGAGRTRLTNAYFDARLKTVGTQRNWKTVKVLAEMLGVG